MRNSPRISLPQHADDGDSDNVLGNIIHLPFGKLLDLALLASLPT
jgi:hypothetical protein